VQQIIILFFPSNAVHKIPELHAMAGVERKNCSVHASSSCLLLLRGSGDDDDDGGDDLMADRMYVLI
jgi:hypothetical protein